MTEAVPESQPSVCPFCLAEKRPEAPICPSCNRDTVPPEALLRERDELLRHRDRLRAELHDKTKGLSEQ